MKNPKVITKSNLSGNVGNWFICSYLEICVHFIRNKMQKPTVKYNKKLKRYANFSCFVVKPKTIDI